ncbi:MAG: insulinase family protein [Burkholderiales bacterium]|nr:insulinase family protein [Burkholderiales bacterium]
MISRLLHKLGFAAVMLALVVGVQAAPDLAQVLPIGPQVTVGQLDNGLTYYIQKNSRPEKRLELRLVVKAGSILEDEDQLGLAHFTEHMAFNGSTHFGKHELISYLQSIGLKFGADLNAYTSFNETVYILPLPTDNPEAVEKGFLVLEDWAQGLSFNAADVDAERAIVLEEWRLGRGAEDRMNQKLFPKLFEGSLYAKRLPIGTKESLEGFSHDAIKRFYKDWYRPNLMAVVVVGDIEPQAAKAMVEAHFSKLKNPANERPRVYANVPVRSQSEALVVTDKEATDNEMMIRYPLHPAPTVLTLGDYRQALVEQLFNSMLGLRIQELTQQSQPPFLGGGSGVSKLVRGYQSFSSGAALGRQGVEPAVDALVQENMRARKFGFSSAELERTKKSMLRQLEQSYAERDKTNSAGYADEYLRNFLEQETIPGIANELEYVRTLLPTIALADVNRYAQEAIPEQAAKLVVYMGTDQGDSPAPVEADLLKRVLVAEQNAVGAREEKALSQSLMEQPPSAGRVVAEQHNASLGLTEWELSNGVRVILKPTDFKNDEILMAVNRFGGQSLYGQADMFNAGYAGLVAASMGVGNFSPTELQKMLAGKVVSVNTGLQTWNDAANGHASQDDLETMLQLLTLKFGPTRLDADLYQSFISRSQDAARHTMASPESEFSNAILRTLFNNHPRVALLPSPSDFDQVSLERSRAIYQDRFASAKGMTFILVGSFTPEAIKPLIARYLGSLPTPDLPMQYVDLGIRPVKGIVKKDVRAGTEAKSTVSISFTGEAMYSDEEQLRVQALVEVLNLRIIDVLREKLTLIYGGGMGGGLSRVPYNHYQLGLTLPCAPDNVDKVIAAALGEIQKLQEAGVDAADLAKVKINWHTTHRKSLRENGYWMGRLASATLYGDDPSRMLDYDRLVDAITPADVQAAAQRYLQRDNYVQVVLYPEK